MSWGEHNRDWFSLTSPSRAGIEQWKRAQKKSGASTSTKRRNPTRGAGKSPVWIDMTEIDLAGRRMRDAAKHYTATTGYKATALISKQVSIKVAPVLKSTITLAAAMAPSGNRSNSGRLKNPAAYNYQPVKTKGAIYDYKIQIGKSKGRGANPIAKAVAPYSAFPFWQGGTQTGYNWSAPKEWLWRASERKHAAMAKAAKHGIEKAYDTMINARPGQFM